MRMGVDHRPVDVLVGVRLHALIAAVLVPVMLVVDVAMGVRE